MFLGDLVDRGPDSPGVLRLAMNMVEAGHALCIPGNHEQKLLRKLRGRDVRLTHGLAETVEQLAREPDDFKARVAELIDGLVSHFVLDGGNLVVAHAGMREELQGRASGKVRQFALYGETTGETDEFGLPVRYDWASNYRGEAHVVYGHTPVPEAVWLNRTICIDTGCVFGGKLAALRYPEKELVSVEAARVYYQPAKPFPGNGSATEAATRAGSDILDIADVQGKRIITTRVHRTVTIREDNAAAALEVMSRFAVDPRWLIYLPPTMSPPETCPTGDILEHPEQAFAYFRANGVPRVICDARERRRGRGLVDRADRHRGEGMVIKPLDWIVRGKRGLVQPAVKCRGREYLRIIYGPTYTEPDNLGRLRRRGLGTKRSLALREFALGLEALHRFVDREPLYRVHECTFGVLALESEPVDPRL